MHKIIPQPLHQFCVFFLANRSRNGFEWFGGILAFELHLWKNLGHEKPLIFQFPIYIWNPGSDLVTWYIGLPGSQRFQRIYKELEDDVCVYRYIPGDSKWPFHQLVGGHLTFERVTNHHPKKVTKKCQVCILFTFLYQFKLSILWGFWKIGRKIGELKRTCCFSYCTTQHSIVLPSSG